MGFHVDAEVGTLEQVLMCQPGVEAYLGSTMPREKALQLESIDINLMRDQWTDLKKMYEGMGVEVVDYKEVLGEVSNPTMSFDELVSGILLKYKGDKDEVGEREGAKREIVEALLHEDVAVYGENAAIAMNEVLVGDLDLETDQQVLANATFTCDPGMLIGPVCVLSKMRDPIRQREVKVYETVMRALGHEDFFHVTEGVFEGGDGMVMNNAFYSGAGSRSTPEAIKQIGGMLHTRFGMESWMAHIPPAPNMPAYRKFLKKAGKLGEIDYIGDMGIMHLDTIAMPVLEGPGQDKTIVYGCKTILQYCQAVPVQQGPAVSLLHHIEGDGYDIKGWGEIRDIPLYEQQQLEPNMTVVTVGKVAGIAPTQTETADMLARDEVYAPRIDMSEFAKCGGRGHCASGQLKKSAPWVAQIYSAANQAVEVPVPIARAV